MFRSLVIVAGCLAAAPASAQVARVSVATDGTQANGPSDSPGISGDGRYVVFASAANNLVAGDTNNLPDIFLRDRDGDADGVFDEAGAVATTRLNLGPGGVQANNASYRPSITPDARFVCFISKASNLAATPVTPEVLQAYRLDRQTGTIIVVSVDAGGVAGNSHSREAAISDDGNVVAFSSEAGNLVGGAQTSTSGIFVREITAGRTTRLSPPGPGSEASYIEPSISADGQRILYRSSAVVGPPSVVFLYDRRVGAARALEVPLPTFARLAPTGRVALVQSLGTPVRVPVDLGPDAQDRKAPSVDTPLAVSATGRLAWLATPVVHDFDTRRGGGPGHFATTQAAAFDRQDRWLAVATTDPDTGNSADTNGLSDIYVYDFTTIFDTDRNGIDIRWVSFYNPGLPSADPDGDGATNAQEFAAGTHPNGRFTRYLAEGATGSFFTTDIALANPSDQDAAVLLTFTTSAGLRLTREAWVLRHGSVVVHAGAVPGLEAADFSTTIESDQFIAVSRTMAWDTRPPYVTVRGYGTHMEIASAAPATHWFLAEGSTVLDFNLFYLLQNPQATTTHATVRFLLPGGVPLTRAYDLPPRSRTTISVNDIPGLGETDVSGDVTADAPISVERAMYRNLPGQPFGLGHAAAGVTAAETRWFLAEGATGSFFDLYVLIANPNASDALVDVQYARPDGSVLTRQHTIRANSRFSIYVDAIPGLENTPVATTVTSTNNVPVVVERSMYWPGGFFDYYEGHVSAGSTAAAAGWLVAGGEDGGAMHAQTFVLIANTSAQPQTVQYAVLTEPGVTPIPPSPDFTLPANSRTTLPITNVDGRFGFLVQTLGTSANLVVEVSVYRTLDGVTWSAGGNALATPLP